MDIKDRIVKKALEFRDASIKMNKAVPLTDKQDPSELSKKIKENQEVLKLLQEASMELFSLLDEFDVMSGKGIQR